MNKFIDLEFVTAVDLNYTMDDFIENEVKNTKPVYHFIYASQLYGTFFGIYAQFVREENKVDDQKNFKISKIELKLLNYKGIINIGFTSHSHSQDRDGTRITFRVRGASSNFEKPLILDPPITVEKGKRTLIIFNRILQPLPDFDGYFDDRQRSDDSQCSEASSKLTDEPPISTLFDSEFNDRDGIDFYNNDLKPGLYENDNETLMAVGHRCNTSKVNLYF